MKKSTAWLLVLALVLLTIVPLYLARGSEFEGADVVAENAITDVNPSYQPWFSPIFEPPSGEIESLIFALQAALGAGFIAYFFGYRRGRANKS